MSTLSVRVGACDRSCVCATVRVYMYVVCARTDCIEHELLTRINLQLKGTIPHAFAFVCHCSINNADTRHFNQARAGVSAVVQLHSALRIYGGENIRH